MKPDFFPYPFVYQGTRNDGSIMSWPDVCQRCAHRACEAPGDAETHLCSYGLNYRRLNDNLLIAGIVLDSFPASTQQRSKRRRKLPIVNNHQFTMACEAYLAPARVNAEAQRQRREAKQEVILDEEQFRADYLLQLKEEISRGLSFFHDYKQINAQISQNINVVIEERYQGDNLEQKLTQASRAERAIYEGAKLLSEKLNVARFLVDPGWLEIAEGCTKFRVHGMVHKYVKLYESWFENRGVQLKEMGRSYNEITANADACGVIAHTFIDNALKYAPAGTQVEVFLEDRDAGVYFDVASFGPELESGEEKKIFRPFYRGQHAKEVLVDGAGYGLYVSQLIAKIHLGTQIEVTQDCARRVGERCWTTFTVEFPARALVV